jgi:hypothetical protein
MSSARFRLYIEEPFDFQNTARCVTGEEEWRSIREAFGRARNAFLGDHAQPPNLELLKVPRMLDTKQ